MAKEKRRPDDDRRGPSIEIPADVDLFDAPALLYEGGEDLDLGEHGRRDPAALPDFDADRR